MFEKVGKRIGLRKDAQVKEKVKVEEREHQSLKKASKKSRTISMRTKERKHAYDSDTKKINAEHNECMIEDYEPKYKVEVNV